MLTATYTAERLTTPGQLLGRLQHAPCLCFKPQREGEGEGGRERVSPHTHTNINQDTFIHSHMHRVAHAKLATRPKQKSEINVSDASDIAKSCISLAKYGKITRHTSCSRTRLICYEYAQKLASLPETQHISSHGVRKGSFAHAAIKEEAASGRAWHARVTRPNECLGKAIPHHSPCLGR